MLRVEHLCKRYGRRTVIRDFTGEVAPGEVVGLLGPNGAGKTTCFYMIVGLVRPDGGRILLDGRDLAPLPMHARALAGLGYLPQEASVFRRLTVEDNVLTVLELNPKVPEKQRRDRLDALLEDLQVDHRRDQLGVSLSGGERRRVEIARALAATPKFMLLDEPFAGVDPISIAEIQRIIASLKARGIGVLITDHNVRETLEICDRAYVINEGEVLAEGNADALVSNEQVRAVYLGQAFRR